MTEHSEDFAQRIEMALRTGNRTRRDDVVALLAAYKRLREALRDLADAYRGIALDHPTVVTRHLPLIMAEEVLLGSDDRG